MHNPYALSPEGEFQTPEGEWWLTCRSIVYDSWLFWSDALPYETVSYTHLTLPTKA